MIEMIKESKIRVTNKIMPITKVNNKMLYLAILYQKTQEPTAVEKWVEQFPFLEVVPWDKILTRFIIQLSVGLNHSKFTAKVRIQNLLILLGKWYINKIRTDARELSFTEYLSLVKSKLQIY